MYQASDLSKEESINTGAFYKSGNTEAVPKKRQNCFFMILFLYPKKWEPRGI